MVQVFGYVLADDEFYAPLTSIVDPGPRFVAAGVPDGWECVNRDIWTAWSPPGVSFAEEGWKIHVSARLERAQHVLDTVAAICFVGGVPFKHVAARFFFLALHHKHANRAQSGKFCAIYPADTEAARTLLQRLAEALDGELGTYILSDRRYGDSRTVHYRYGSFANRTRMRPDGTKEPLVRNGLGREVVDRRQPGFVLPDGVTDPFLAEEPAPHAGPLLIHEHYEILTVLQPSNAGGAYKARDTRTGDTVFIKEARAHNGLSWDGLDACARLRREHQTLTELHGTTPGLAPQPLEYFTEWEHDFLVTEYVPGQPLHRWVTQNSPIVQTRPSAEDFVRYYSQCQQLLASLDDALGRLHGLGYRFGDISPGNVIVSDNGTGRFVDFEAASVASGPPIQMGTQGYVPHDSLAADSTDPFLRDHYAMSALALNLLAPMHGVAERAPANLALLRRDLVAMAPLPQSLWARATAFYGVGSGAGDQPTPEQLDADPLTWLAALADRLAQGLLDLADVSRPEWVFPPSPEALQTNTICVAHGTAGVVHALHLAGVPVPEIEKRLRQDAMAERHELPPGLHVGSAGIAWVLAELGVLDEALDLLEIADGHPVARTSNTLADGRAGIGLAWLALFHRTRDPRHLDRAVRAGDAVLHTPDLVASLGPDDAVGLLRGRSGLALFLHYLARDAGGDRYLEFGRRLIHEELNRALPLPDGRVSFPDNAVLRRAMPYLAVGSAGVGMVLARYVGTTADERFSSMLPGVLADTEKTCTAHAGLYTGLAGLAYSLADHADRADDDTHRQAAIRVAAGLWKHAVPRRTGVGVLSGMSARFSADLGGGSSGVLLAVNRLLHGPGDHFFTLDRSTPGSCR